MARKGRRQASRHGYVVIDKPADWTSHDVVAKVRRLVDERRVGHAGTLDPAATGVLPLAVGLATRTIEYLAAADKSYRATIRFGIVTDSADAEGEVVATHDPSHLTLGALTAALDQFQGEISQVPPMHSAIKVNGQRLYNLARKGESVEIAPRDVTISELTIVDWSPPDLTVDVTCSKGTYIRSLARDLGEVVGTGAHLASLRRTRTGPFTLATAFSLDDLAERLARDGWESTAMPPDAVLDTMPQLRLEDDLAVAWGQGKAVPAPENLEVGTNVRVYSANGQWVGIGEVTNPGDTVRPVKVIPVESS